MTIPEGDFATQPEHTFQYLDRRGNEVISIQTELVAPYMPMELLACGLNKKDGVIDAVGQTEDISMQIEWRDQKGSQ